MRQVLTSAVYDVAVETPLDHAPRLSDTIGNRIFFKREDMQPVFSFKLRGAYNKVASLSDDDLKRGVICSSAGNHAQGVALSASRRGAKSIICMPTTTPAIKVEAVKRLGGQVVLHGESYSGEDERVLKISRWILLPPCPHAPPHPSLSSPVSLQRGRDALADTQQYAIARAQEEGLVFVHPYDDPHVIVGQGTVGLEILRQCPDAKSLSAIFGEDKSG